MTRHLGIPFSGFTPEERAQFKVILCDVEATLLKGGKLYPSVLKALWELKKSGRTVVLLTEGSSGAAESFLKLWPIDAVIAENGALMICYGKKGEVLHLSNPAIAKEKVLFKRINLMNMTKGLAFASDQAARIFDVAFDKSKLAAPERKILQNTFLSLGANSLETNQYIHAWFGDYHWKSAVQYFLQGPLKLEEEYYLEHSLYIGGGKQAEELFDYFLYSIGVKKAENSEKTPILPNYMTEATESDGFCEVVKALLGF